MATPTRKNSKATGFVSEIVAVVKGSDAQQIGEKIQKQMSNGLNAQIALKEAATFDLEEAVERAEEQVKLSLMNNGKDVTDREATIQSYLNAQVALRNAKTALENHLQVIEWLKEGQAIVNA